MRIYVMRRDRPADQPTGENRNVELSDTDWRDAIHALECHAKTARKTALKLPFPQRIRQSAAILRDADNDERIAAKIRDQIRP